MRAQRVTLQMKAGIKSGFKGMRSLFLLQAEAFVHQPLYARAVEDIVGKLFVGKHAQGGAPGIRGHFRRLFDCEVGVLADDRHYHAHHDLEAPQSSSFFRAIIVLPACLSGWLDFHKNSRPLSLDDDCVFRVCASLAIVPASSRESSCP